MRALNRISRNATPQAQICHPFLSVAGQGGSRRQPGVQEGGSEVRHARKARLAPEERDRGRDGSRVRRTGRGQVGAAALPNMLEVRNGESGVRRRMLRSGTKYKGESGGTTAPTQRPHQNPRPKRRRDRISEPRNQGDRRRASYLLDSAPNLDGEGAGFGGESRTAARRRRVGSAGLAPTSLRPHGVHRSERLERVRGVSCPAEFIGKWWWKEALGCGLFTWCATGGAVGVVICLLWLVVGLDGCCSG